MVCRGRPVVIRSARFTCMYIEFIVGGVVLLFSVIVGNLPAVVTEVMARKMVDVRQGPPEIEFSA